MAGAIAGSDPGWSISKPVPWPRRTCEPLLSFSKEGRTAPAAVCSVDPFFIAAGGAGVVKLIGGEGTEFLGNAVPAFLSNLATSNDTLTGRGIAGAV